MTQVKCSIINCWHADSQNDGRTSHGWERGGGGREDAKPKSRRHETLMRRDSLTELGHTYWKQSSNAEHHPPKPSRKPWTTGNRVIWVPRRRWKRVKMMWEDWNEDLLFWIQERNARFENVKLSHIWLSGGLRHSLLGITIGQIMACCVVNHTDRLSKKFVLHLFFPFRISQKLHRVRHCQDGDVRNHHHHTKFYNWLFRNMRVTSRRLRPCFVVYVADQQIGTAPTYCVWEAVLHLLPFPNFYVFCPRTIKTLSGATRSKAHLSAAPY